MVNTVDTVVSLPRMLLEEIPSLSSSRNATSPIGDYSVYYIRNNDQRGLLRWMFPDDEYCFETIGNRLIQIPAGQWDKWYGDAHHVAVNYENMTGQSVTIAKVEGFQQFY